MLEWYIIGLLSCQQRMGKNEIYKHEQILHHCSKIINQPRVVFFSLHKEKFNKETKKMEDKERRRKPMEIFRGAKLSFILQKMNETLSYGWI